MNRKLFIIVLFLLVDKMAVVAQKSQVVLLGYDE